MSVTLTSHGHEFDTSATKFGELRRSDGVLADTAELRRRMEEDGYLYLPGLLDGDVVLNARRELLEKLRDVGEIDPQQPLMEAIHSGASNRKDYGVQKFAKELRTGRAVRELCQRGRIMAFFDRFLHGTARCFDYLWMRTVAPGRATGCHYDVVYMGMGTHSLYSTWIPVGDVPLRDSGLFILEGSHRFEELKRTYGAMDVDRDRDNNPYGGGWFSNNPREVQERFGGRWLTNDFQVGDALIFGMFTMHCSSDNQSERVRLSTDSRYQLVSEPADGRWVGEDPPMHDVEKQKTRGLL